MNGIVLICGLVALSPLAHAGQSLNEANPMRKIIGMLQDMQKELEREGEIEKEIFEKALCACEGGEGELTKVIDDSNAAIEEFTAKVASGEAEKAQLKQDVIDHKTTEEEATKELDQATVLREKDYKAFQANQKDTQFNIASLGKAIPAIEKGMGGAALMQMPGVDRFRRFVEVTKFMNSDDRSSVLAFLDQGSDDG